jgi:uncharacterized protein (DUF427 family)
VRRERPPSLPDWARRGRSGWRYNGSERPEFAVEPAPGQESVWDYPRPPKLATDSRSVAVRAGEVLLAETHAAFRICETAAPPTFYLPPDDVRMAYLEPVSGSSRCEWKGEAGYWDVVTPRQRLERAAWSYPDPFGDFEPIRGYLCFYPALLECFVDGQRVLAQPGRFYGGWVTPELVGPFKGEPGSEGW